MSSYLFTSESVSEGHPDKVADQISDAVLDAILAQDKRARVACETMVKTGVAIVAGEVTTSAWVDIEALARKVICDIGYTDSDVGFDGATCGVLNLIGKQSTDIAAGVDRKKPEEQGAGDQGLMFGYACNEAPEFMPAPIYYAHRLVEQQAKVRKQKNSKLPWLRPDAKSQVTLRYDDQHNVIGLDAVVLSTQHDPDIKHKALVEGVYEQILKPVLPKAMLDKLPKNKVHINPTGIARSSSTRTAAWPDTVAARSPARIRRRSIAVLHMPHATSPRISSPPGSPTAARCRCHTRSAWPSRPRSRSRPSAPARSATTGSRSSSAVISTCARTASSRCST